MIDVPAWRRRVLPDVTEAVLNHISGSRAGVGVHQRHEWEDERRAALNAWGARFAATVEGREADRKVTFPASPLPWARRLEPAAPPRGAGLEGIREIERACLSASPGPRRRVGGQARRASSRRITIGDRTGRSTQWASPARWPEGLVARRAFTVDRTLRRAAERPSRELQHRFPVRGLYQDQILFSS